MRVTIHFCLSSIEHPFEECVLRQHSERPGQAQLAGLYRIISQALRQDAIDVGLRSQERSPTRARSLPSLLAPVALIKRRVRENFPPQKAPFCQSRRVF